MFITRKINLSMTRGDTLAFGLRLKGLGHPADQVRFSCSKSYNGDYIFSKDFTNSLLESDDENPTYSIRISPDDTYNVEPGDYLYDFEVQANNDVLTILKGTLTIEPDVSR